MTVNVSMTINGEAVGPVEIPEDLMMAEFLHEYLNLTGTRISCEQGVCYACSIIVDGAEGGRIMPACVTGALWCDGRSVRTIEGHATRDDEGRITALSPVQEAFLTHFSFQCSYCTPGFVNAATVLVERLGRQPVPRARLEDEILEAMNGNICRCTGYVRYLTAVRDVILATPGLVTGDEGDAA
ncbi:(2Fe-2S)-binding protein [Frigidibacter sp. SD6-1]|uniref:(2Fe-2S)-binding protein n=1 Tax=Frigidibacter sp. SD6-1 TaxID=3032581 RepID=UPI0024DFDA50|nr:(2Fe-2S)-binding protein [Frigidibacter sp. SD6-1]